MESHLSWVHVLKSAIRCIPCMLNNVGLNPVERHTLESVRHPGDFSSMLDYAAVLGAGHQMEK